MLSQQRIARWVQSRSYGTLVGAILSNGRNSCQTIRGLLTHPDAVAPAALGLALQRLDELSYGPNPLAEQIVRLLLAMQADSGQFGGSNPAASRAATAVACRGLLGWTARRNVESGMHLLSGQRSERSRGIRDGASAVMCRSHAMHPPGETSCAAPSPAVCTSIERAVSLALQWLRNSPGIPATPPAVIPDRTTRNPIPTSAAMSEHIIHWQLEDVIAPSAPSRPAPSRPATHAWHDRCTDAGSTKERARAALPGISSRTESTDRRTTLPTPGHARAYHMATTAGKRSAPRKHATDDVELIQMKDRQDQPSWHRKTA